MASHRSKPGICRCVAQLARGGHRPFPVYEACDLRELVNAAKLKAIAENGDVDLAFFELLRDRIRIQRDDLLRSLDLDPSSYERNEAFERLAQRLGVGRLSWSSPKKRNLNALLWTQDHDGLLAEEVLTLKLKEGLSNREALQRIGDDAAKRHLFPYRGDELVTKSEHRKRRRAALVRHWQKIRKRGDTFIEALQECFEIKISDVEGVLNAIDRANDPAFVRVCEKLKAVRPAV